MFESRISAGATEKLPGWQKPHAQTVACSYDMEGHAQRCVERHCEMANKKVEQLYNVSNPCLDDHQFKQEELESAGELSEVCSQLVLKCLYLARSGRPDTLWSVNKLARSVAKWTQACDRRLARLISYFITRTISDSIVMWETRHSIADWVCFKTQTLLEILRTQSQLQEVSCVFLEAEHFVPVSWMCKKQTSVSHSSTESEIISLDAGLRGWVTCSRPLGHGDGSVTFN